MLTYTRSKYLLASFALLVIPISGLSIDIYVPSLPAVSDYFGVNKAYAQLSITTYMVGLGLMQLFSGSLSDSFGRKKPYLMAMFIYILATLFVPLSHNIHQLLILRFIQGSAVALTVVPMRSVILDLFEGRELQKMMTYMTMVWSIGPIIAPAIGGYLQHFFGWKACFYFLAIYSFIIFILTWIYLPETSEFYHPFRINQIITRYCQSIFNWNYMSGLVMDGLLYSLIILFSIVGPFLIQTVLHHSAIEFGQVALFMGSAWFLGTMTNRILIDISLNTKANVCLWSMFIISLIMLLMTFMFPINLYNIVIPIAIMLWLGGIVFPNYFTRSISLFPKTTGSANALFGSFVFLVAGISSGLGTMLKAVTERPLAGAFVLIIILCLLIHHLEGRIETRSQS